ncbi:MAG: cytochrome P450/oxidoreductase [Pseudomonadota bacterium]
MRVRVREREFTASAVPSDPTDFYSDAVIADPVPYYARLRALGPVVWLPAQQAYALPRYAEVSTVLRQPLLFSSAEGVSLNPKVNAVLKGSTLNSDPPDHDRTRAVTSAPLLPGALPEIEPRVRAAADGLVDTLCRRGRFDAVTDFAQYLPVTLVAELVGLPENGRDNMLKWASATFNLFANDNARARAAFDDLADLARFLKTYGHPDKLKPGGWAQRIFERGAQAGLTFDTCAQLMRDYINPSLDTTISATGQIIKLFADNPDEWTRLREHPALVDNAIEEAVRLATPIRAFSRVVSEDTRLAGVALPRGARVIVIYASANRDERKFADPDRFDIGRDVHDHVGFGQGVHMCMGMHLARLEMRCLLEALMARVTAFEVLAEPTVAWNNTIRAFSRMPVRVVLDASPRSSAVQRTPPPAADWIEVRVERVTDETDSVRAFELRPHDGTRLPAFDAGAHIDVQIAPGLVRQYSLCDAPAAAPARYRIGVLREPGSRGGSEHLHTRVAAGTVLKISPPRNHFPLVDNDAPAVLCAGGIGVTPLLSMASALLAQGRPFAMHYFVRIDAEPAFRGGLSGLGDRVTVHRCGRAGVVDVVRSWAVSGQSGGQLYVCGPAGFIDVVLQSAAASGWAADQLHAERFGAEIDTDGDPFEVHAARRGVTVTVAPGETIVSALAERGIEVPVSCQSGVCGTCLTPVLSGTPEHRDWVQTDREKAANDRVAVCCSRARTRTLVLDL